MIATLRNQQFLSHLQATQAKMLLLPTRNTSVEEELCAVFQSPHSAAGPATFPPAPAFITELYNNHTVGLSPA